MNPRQKAKAEKKANEPTEIAVIKEKPKPEKEYDKQSRLDGWDKVTEWRLEAIKDINEIKKGWKEYIATQREKKTMSEREFISAMNTYERIAMNAGRTMDDAAKSGFFAPNVEQVDDEQEKQDNEDRKAMARLKAEIALKRPMEES